RLLLPWLGRLYLLSAHREKAIRLAWMLRAFHHSRLLLLLLTWQSSLRLCSSSSQRLTLPLALRLGILQR
ncbi:hypothetical protein FOZ62_018050, partial [Perkinsus olseni]